MIRKLLALLTRPATMTAGEAHQAVTSDGAVLLDVREQSEWQAGRAPQARHLVLNQLQDHLGELPTDRPIITVCRSGRRSGIAANTLTRHGYQVTNLTGGMNAWAAAGLPVIPNGGKPGKVI
jgi:rhodanese-related sulfurtransferase